jgi:hypothetical protein
VLRSKMFKELTEVDDSMLACCSHVEEGKVVYDYASTGSVLGSKTDIVRRCSGRY